LPTQRGLVITMVLMTSAIFQGLAVVQVYAEPLFAEAVPEMSPILCTVLFATSIVVASVTAAFMSDVTGRRVGTKILQINLFYTYIHTYIYIPLTPYHRSTTG
jgi:hypothetical protein